MRVYIATKFEKKELVHELASKLKSAGHSLSYDWTTHKPIKPYEENQSTAKLYSENEVQGILDSDIFICIPDKLGHTLFMEIGAALMLKKTRGKPEVYVIGEFNKDSPWYFNPLIKRRDNIEQVIEEIINL